MNKQLKRILPFAVLTGLLGILALRAWSGQTVATQDAIQHYYSSSASGAPQFEGAVQAATGVKLLGSLYAVSSSGSTVYLKVQDSGNAGTDNGPCVLVLPVSAGAYVSLAGGPYKVFTNGIYLAPFTDITCTNSAGSVLFYSVDYK